MLGWKAGYRGDLKGTNMVGMTPSMGSCPCVMGSADVSFIICTHLDSAAQPEEKFSCLIARFFQHCIIYRFWNLLPQKQVRTISVAATDVTPAPYSSALHFRLPGQPDPGQFLDQNGNPVFLQHTHPRVRQSLTRHLVYSHSTALNFSSIN